MNKPEWFDHPIPQDPEFFRMKKRLRESGLHTICQEARCPNAGTCFSEETATFLILGDTCTRKCGFCSVKKGTPLPPEQSEIDRILEMIEGLGLDYAVITSVTRDDLTDGGVGHYLKLLEGLRKRLPNLKIETLIPDFLGKVENWQLLLSSPPDVLNHNIES
ncbi:MAG TPA: lipoyl synthase, partial [Candidatus Aminicenantes bacterium]|nr:lipoyl synthase [Candidatus Aminicenantes bacterium]